jgi:hypothetical protein
MHYILTRNGAFLHFKHRNTANQKLIEKKLMSDRNCCPSALQPILPQRQHFANSASFDDLVAMAKSRRLFRLQFF